MYICIYVNIVCARRCLRVSRECTRENAALLSFVAQGNARALTVSTLDASVSNPDQIGSGEFAPVGRSVGGRAVVRLYIHIHTYTYI